MLSPLLLSRFSSSVASLFLTMSSPSSSSEDRDTLYRSHLRSLASLLVPPSAPIVSSLLATALFSLSSALATPLEWRHDEQNIDFWDARREKDWGEGREERWEMSREEVEGIKRERKECADRVREAGRDEERWQLGSCRSLLRCFSTRRADFLNSRAVVHPAFPLRRLPPLPPRSTSLSAIPTSEIEHAGATRRADRSSSETSPPKTGRSDACDGRYAGRR